MFAEREGGIRGSCLEIVAEAHLLAQRHAIANLESLPLLRVANCLGRLEQRVALLEGEKHYAVVVRHDEIVARDHPLTHSSVV
jgi:hypothetical protein